MLELSEKFVFFNVSASRKESTEWVKVNEKASKIYCHQRTLSNTELDGNGLRRLIYDDLTPFNDPYTPRSLSFGGGAEMIANAEKAHMHECACQHIAFLFPKMVIVDKNLPERNNKCVRVILITLVFARYQKKKALA